MYACRVIGSFVFAMFAGVAVAQLPGMQIPQPNPAPQPAQMPQPGQMSSAPQMPSMPDPGGQGPKQQPQSGNQQRQQNQSTRSRYQSAGFIGGWCAVYYRLV
jgi:hypothetical protein